MKLKDLSDLLGLSPTTVSRALNGYPEVGAATRERVLAAAARYNYAPNARAKGLATGRANAIGHVIPISSKRETLNPVFGDFIAGANEVYAREGFEMVLSMVEDVLLEDAFVALKTRGSVDGVILHWPVANDPRIGLLTKINLPFVVHGRVPGATVPYSWVDINNRTAFRQATEYLLDLGHKRIALINGREALDFASKRLPGYSAALEARGIAFDEALHASDEMTEEHGHRAAARMLAGRDPPSAFLASSVMVAWGIRRAAEEIGLKLGKDVSVITHDDALYYISNDGDPPVFTAVRSSVRKAGNLAAEMMVKQIREPAARERDSILLTCEFVEGTSTGPFTAE